MYTKEQLEELATHCRPTPGRIAVVFDEHLTKTEAGIFLPESKDEDAETCTIFAVGPERPNEPHGLQLFERAFVNKWAGHDMEIDIGLEEKVKIKVLDGRDVMCVFGHDTKVSGVQSVLKSEEDSVSQESVVQA